MREKKRSNKKPQVTVQMPENLRVAYDLAGKIGGFTPAKLCAAGFLALLENPSLRIFALRRLSDFEHSGPPAAGIQDWLIALLTHGISAKELEAGASAMAAAVDAGASEERPQSKGRTVVK